MCDGGGRWGFGGGGGVTETVLECATHGVGPARVSPARARQCEPECHARTRACVRARAAAAEGVGPRHVPLSAPCSDGCNVD